MIDNDPLNCRRVTPEQAIKLARAMPSRSSFFVRGETPLFTGETSYLPLAGNVQVTKKAVIQYLKDIEKTAAYRMESHGDVIHIDVTTSDHCFFV